MKKTLKVLTLTAILMLIAGAMLVGGAVATAGPQQVVQWLGLPLYVTHGENGWQIDTPAYYSEPQERTWEGDADEVTRLRMDAVDTDLKLVAVEGIDTVRLTWYELRENEYTVSLENGSLELAYEEMTGIINFDVSSVWEEHAEIPDFVLEYPAGKGWLAVVLTGVDGEIRADETLYTEQITVDLVDGELSMPVTTGRFSLDAVDAQITVGLDSEIIDLDLVDSDVEMTLAGTPEDYRFDLKHVDAEFTLNGESYVDEDEMMGDWDLGDGDREVRISGVDAEVNVVTGLR